MKLYTFPPAANPRKLNTYLREKGLEIPTVWINLLENEHKTPEFLARNPMAKLPVLELDDGTILTESLAIIEYLEELHPEPPMIGTTPVERARVRRLERIVELGVLGPVAGIVHNTKSPLPEVKPNPEIASYFKARLEGSLQHINREIGERPFVAGDRPSIADCTLFGALEFGRFFGVEFDPGCTNLHRWWAAFGERPSAKIVPPA